LPRVKLPLLLFALLAAWICPIRAVAEDDDEDDGEEVRAADETVVVVGERDPVESPEQDTSAAVTVIELDERQRASASVAEVVGATAGVHLQRLGGLGHFSAVTIRGSSARQVQVHVDGVPLNPYGGSSVNLEELPLDAFETIEVYRSGAPAHLGAGAMGGVVNLVTAPGRLPPPRLELAGGSYWTRRLSAEAGTAWLGERAPGDVLMSVETSGTRGDFLYFDDHGTVYNLFDDGARTRLNNDLAQMDARGRLRLGDRSLQLVVQEAVLARGQGLPGIGHDPALHARLGVLGHSLLTELSGRPRANVKLRGRASWRVRRESYRDPEGELGTGQQDSRDVHQAAGGLVSVRWVPLSWQAVEATAELRVDTYEPVDLLREDSSDGVRSRVAAVFSASDDFSLAGDRVRISPVLQLHLLDNRMLGTVPFGDAAVAPDAERHVVAFTPQLGLLVRPVDALAIKANVARSFRPPDFTELFGDRGAVIGNSALVPETGIAWDVGARLAGGGEGPVGGSLSLGYFWRHTWDAIVYVQNSQRTQIPTNFGEARVSGVEASGQVSLFDMVDLATSVTWMDSVNLDPREAYLDKQLPGVPRWEVWAELAWHLDHRLRVAYDASHTSGNYWDATNWYLSAPRTVHGMSLRVQPGRDWPFVELDVRNLFDERLEAVPRDPLNPDDGAVAIQPLTDFAGYPLPGRTLMVTVGWSPTPARSPQDSGE
jgi:vitamin B12 transporter